MGKDNGLGMQILPQFLTQIFGPPILFMWGFFPPNRRKTVAPLSILFQLNQKQLDLEAEVISHEILDIGNFPIRIARSGSDSVSGALNYKL